MKNLASLAVLAAISTMSVTAFADTSVAYTGGTENYAMIAGIDGYSSVIITDCDNNIVYVNQEDSAFSGIKSFLMKNSDSNPVGAYTATFGSSSGSYETKTFYVGVNSDASDDVPMTRLSSNLCEDDKYSTGFFRTVSASEFENYNSLKVGYNNGLQNVWGGFSLKANGFPTTTGGGDLTLIFELNQIEEDEIGSVSVFLSPDQVGSANAYQ